MAIVATSSEFTINSLTDGFQGASDVAALTTGGFVVTWITPGSDDPELFFDNVNVRARVFGADGAAAADDFLVNTILEDEQNDPAVIGLAGGAFLVVYADGSDATVGGTYVTARGFAADGTPLFDDWRYAGGSGDYWTSYPAPVLLSDGTVLVVSGGEDSGEGYLLDVNGQTVTPGFVAGGSPGDPPYDYVDVFVPQGVAALADGDVAHVYTGHRQDNDGNSLASGVLLWLREADGTPIDGPIQVSEPGDEFPSAPVIAQLGDGTIVVAWTSYDSDPRFGASSDIYYRLFDAAGVAQGGAVLAHAELTGAQSSVDIVATPDGGFLLTWQDDSGAFGDTSGAAILARTYGADGAADGGAFQVNSATAGHQADPHAALLASGEVVISWTDGGTGDVKARTIYDVAALPDCPVLDRAGTQDGSSPADQVLSGPAFANSFYFGGLSGDDRIAGFQKVDVLVAATALFDANGDGVVTPGTDGIYDLSGGTVDVAGVWGLRSLGEACAGSFVYADASVRPFGAIEGTLGDDALSGDAGDATGQVFFFDTALNLSLGADSIARFGARDVLVTTTRVADSNDDGIITLGGDKRLGVDGADIGLKGLNGKAITKVEFDGTVTHGGVDYYVYSQVGSAVGTEAVIPQPEPEEPQEALYFLSFQEGYGDILYKLLPGGTPQVFGDLGPDQYARVPQVFAGDIYLTTDDGYARVDGETGEVALLGIRANPELADYVLGREYDGAFYVSGWAAGVGGEIFRIEPDSPTAQALDSVPGPVGSDPNVPFGHEGYLYYPAYTYETGSELFRQNALTGDTQIFDIAPGSADVAESFPTGFTAFDGDVYFTASDGLGTDLFRYDTATNTVQAIKVAPGDETEAYRAGLAVIGDTLFFIGNSTATGAELYKLAAGGDAPVLVSDIAPGGADGFPLGLTVFDGDLVFTADDGVSGREVHRYDTATGTVSSLELIAGAGGPSAGNFTLIDDVLYFIGESAASGRELYRWDPGAAAPVLIDATPGAESTFDAGSFSEPGITGWNEDVLFRDKDGALLLLDTSDNSVAPVDLGFVPYAGDFVVM